MKKLILLLAMVAISRSIVFSQGCLPEGIDFYYQTEIDSFQINYPGCTQIEGNVTIWGSDITNLLGLSVLTSIDLNFGIGQCYSLSSLSGLDNLTSVGSFIWIQDCDILTNFEGLGSLTNVGGESLSITWNNNLISLDGLENLEIINGSLNIVGNNSLENISGLKNVDDNFIDDLNIFGNSNLQECDILSICNYLISPNGTIEIHNNAPGCNSQTEVEAACLTSVEENITNEAITIFPNPATSFITINLSGGQPIEEAIIYNHIGQKVLNAKPANNTVDVSVLKPGIYFLEVITRDSRAGTKLAVE